MPSQLAHHLVQNALLRTYYLSADQEGGEAGGAIPGADA